MPKQKKVLLVVSLLLAAVLLWGGIFLYKRATTRCVTWILGFHYDVSVVETRWDEEENLWFIRVQTSEIETDEPFWLPVKTKPASFGQGFYRGTDLNWGTYYNEDVNQTPLNQSLPMIMFTMYYNDRDFCDAVETYSEEYNLSIPEGFVESHGANDLILYRKILLLKMTEEDWAKEHVRVNDIQCD